MNVSPKQTASFNLKTTKTARIFTLGEISKSTKDIWIVFHGYGFHGKYFLEKFKILQNQATVIFAPEALSRFYKGGFSGRVGASWMTKEDRENEIADYVLYLNNLHLHIKNQYEAITEQNFEENIKLNLLAFSQGGATCARWIFHSKPKINKLVFWACNLPQELDYLGNKDFLKQSKNHFVYGLEDEFLEWIKKSEFLGLIEQLDFQLITFNGKHEINEEVLLKICAE